MKLLTTLLIISTISFQSVGQNKNGDNTFTIVEEAASFPGGLSKFYQYINDNLIYPKDAKKQKIAGKIYIEFFINVDGSVDKDSIRVMSADEVNKTLPPRPDGTKPEVMDLTESCNNEAIRVIRNSPRWTPGKLRNAPNRQKFVIPIQFGR